MRQIWSMAHSRFGIVALSATMTFASAVVGQKKTPPAPPAKPAAVPQRQTPPPVRPNQQLPGQRLPNQQLPGQQPSNQQLPGQRLPNQQLPGQQPSNQQLPGQRLPNQQLPGQRLPNQQLPGQRLPNQQLPGQRQPNQQLPGQRQPNQQLPNQRQPNQPARVNIKTPNLPVGKTVTPKGYIDVRKDGTKVEYANNRPVALVKPGLTAKYASNGRVSALRAETPAGVQIVHRGPGGIRVAEGYASGVGWRAVARGGDRPSERLC